MTYCIKVRIYGRAVRKQEYEIDKPWYMILNCELHVILNDLLHDWDVNWEHKHSEWM